MVFTPGCVCPLLASVRVFRVKGLVYIRRYVVLTAFVFYLLIVTCITMPKKLSDLSSEEKQQQDVVQLFASEDELDENSEKPTTRSVSNHSNTAPITGNGPGNGPWEKKG